MTALKNQEDVVESLYDRILGRVSVHNVIHPQTGDDCLCIAGEEITEDIASTLLRILRSKWLKSVLY
jgi:DNA-directed RNA polymerase subunit beta'